MDRTLRNAFTVGPHTAQPALAAAPHDPLLTADACRSALGRPIIAGIDEVPDAYKDIHDVMAPQADLVESLGRFDPRIMKMAPEGEKPED